MTCASHSFIVRIWHEDEEVETTSAHWKGFVQHVGHADETYFVNLATLMIFIEEKADMVAGDTTYPERVFADTCTVQPSGVPKQPDL